MAAEARGAFPRTYPRLVKLINDLSVTLRLMGRGDRDAVLTFARTLPADDLLFLRTDITEEKVVEDWLHNIEAGRTITILAESDGKLIGYGSLIYNEVLWTRHVGEIRVLVGPDYRRSGLGRRLASEVFEIAKALGLRKMMAQMTPDQRAARATFERLGFKPEALLADFVLDRQGRPRDLLIMSHDVAGFTAD